MPEVELVVATPEHARELAGDMRADEVLEVRAALDLDPEAALLKLIGASTFARAVFFGGELGTIFGVVESRDGAGFPWVLSSNVVERYPLSFWRTSKLVLAELRKIYPVLIEYVDARYTRSIAWAKRLGFTIAPAEPHGLAQLPFHPLAIEGLVS